MKPKETLSDKIRELGKPNCPYYRLDVEHVKEKIKELKERFPLTIPNAVSFNAFEIDKEIDKIFGPKLLK